jgi:predicted dehydrogenase
VDTEVDRARSLAWQFGVRKIAGDLSEVLDDVDGVVVTTPHNAHYPIAMQALAAGKHVLCEKPLAERAIDARDMIRAAKESRVTLSVNLSRRLFPASREVRRLVQSGSIGELKKITVVAGEKFDWPATSGFYFGVGGAPHGVLLDKGPHLIDIVCWWLGAKPEVAGFLDDSSGGGEAMCSVRMKLGDCDITVELSNLNGYRNGVVIAGHHATIELPLYSFKRFDIIRPDLTRTRVRMESPVTSLSGFGAEMMDNFVGVLRGSQEPAVPASSVIDSIEIIEECYRRRTRYAMPWQEWTLGDLR